MSVSGVASVPAIKQYLNCVKAAGIDYLPCLEEAGIASTLLADNNGLVHGNAMQALVLLLARATDDPCLGLHAARHVEPSSYSVLGYISINCANLGEVLARIPIFEKIVGDMGVSSVKDQGEHVLLRWSCQFTDPMARRHEVEAVLGSWYLYARDFLHVEGDFVESVWFEHSAPEDSDLLFEYKSLFAADVFFDMPDSGFLIPRSALEQPLPQANEKLLHNLLEYAAERLVELDRSKSLTDRVKNLLRLMLKETAPSTALIAEKLGMGSRTLQRKLQQEGTNYGDVLNEMRLELAYYYLKHTQLSLEVIASKLGYIEPRSFYRSFKQWTGRTAGSYRGVTEDSE